MGPLGVVDRLLVEAREAIIRVGHGLDALRQVAAVELGKFFGGVEGL